jgi:SAM-dependent methyltransferase
VVDLDRPWRDQFEVEQYDAALALDVIEHLQSPERGAGEIFDTVKSGGKLYASTGNIAFLPLRLALLLGWFNYGRRGILDLTHHRLFTVASFRRLLRDAGFRIDRVIGFGPPLADLFGNRLPFRALDRVAAWLARVWPTMFAYQIMLECTRTDSPADLMPKVFAESRPARLPREELSAAGADVPGRQPEVAVPSAAQMGTVDAPTACSTPRRVM